MFYPTIILLPSTLLTFPYTSIINNQNSLLSNFEFIIEFYAEEIFGFVVATPSRERSLVPRLRSVKNNREKSIRVRIRGSTLAAAEEKWKGVGEGEWWGVVSPSSFSFASVPSFLLPAHLSFRSPTVYTPCGRIYSRVKESGPRTSAWHGRHRVQLCKNCMLIEIA